MKLKNFGPLKSITTEVVFVLIAINIIACNLDKITTNVTTENAFNYETTSSNSDLKMVPHKGMIFFYPIAVAPTDDPQIVHIFYEGEGKASHFGKFTETGEYLLHSDNNGTPLFISDVVATRYTANGDQVFLTNVTGIISLTGDVDHPLILEGDFNYENGTGRFEGVSGSIHWLAVGNPDGSALSNFKGTISTVGAIK